MKEDIQIVLEEQEKRYKLLYEVWKSSKRDTRVKVNATELVMIGVINPKDCEQVLCYLVEEGLIQDDGKYVALTHKGLKEIEDSIKEPQKSTEHFTSVVIQHFHAEVGVVQTGNESKANLS